MAQDPAEPKLTRKDRLKIVYMPLLVVALTAILGSGIGIWLQNRSFRKNELFKAKLERIMAAQREAVDVLRSVDEARRQIRVNESFINEQLGMQVTSAAREAALDFYQEKNPISSNVEVLKEARLKMDVLSGYTGTLSAESPVPASVESFTAKLDDYLRCLEGNSEFEKICSEEHADIVNSLQGVIAAYSQMADKLIEDYS